MKCKWIKKGITIPPYTQRWLTDCRRIHEVKILEKPEGKCPYCGKEIEIE